MYAAYNILTANKNLPVSLDYVKHNLRMDDLSHADDLIIGIIKACSSHVERLYGLALLTQTIAEYWTAFPTCNTTPMMLRIQPVLSITSVKYLDNEGIEQTWDNADYMTGRYNNTTFLIPKANKIWPTAMTHPNAATITYSAGFGPTIETIPQDVRDAITLMATARFERPDDPVISLPRASELLLAPFYPYTA